MQEDVDQFMKQSGNGSVELVLKRFDEQYKKYKFLEANLVAKRKRYTFSGFFFCIACFYYVHVLISYCRLRSQIPDIETTLKTVKFMKSKQVHERRCFNLCTILIPLSFVTGLP